MASNWLENAQSPMILTVIERAWEGCLVKYTMRGMFVLGMKRLWLLLWLVALLVPGGFAATAEVPVLGLNQMIQMALEKSPEMKEAEQDIAAAQSELAQAKAGQWAQFDLFAVTGPAQNADIPTVLSQSAGGGKYVGQITNNDKNGLGIFGSLDFVMIQPLFTFGKISFRQDAASYGVDAQRAAKDKKHAQVVLNIKELYYGVIVAKQGVGAADDANQFIKDARQRIQRLLDLGSPNVSDVDLYRLETFESDVMQFKAKAEAGARVAYLALKKNIGLKDDQEFELDLKELPKDTRELDRQDEYMERALANRPELQELKKGIEARKALVDAARADLYPSLFFGAVGSLAGAPGRERMPISYYHDDFNHNEAGFFLGANWHFDFGIGAGKVNKAKAEHQKLLHTKEYAERNIPLEVAKYYQDATECQKSFKAFEKGMIAARKWIVSAFANFDIGTGAAKDMFDAIDRYGKNRGDYLVSLYNYHVALAKLAYAAGERWSEPANQVTQ
jgi:outer membrane protein